jgi:hypothetical protein
MQIIANTSNQRDNAAAMAATIARWLQLATVALDGSPRVRTLVFRGWADAAVLDLLTDGRSAKTIELQQQPVVELCWLLPQARSQFRLRGIVQSLPAAVVQVVRFGAGPIRGQR